MRSGPLPGPGAGGEHHRVGALHVGAQVLLGLHVAHHGLGADRLEVGAVVGVADQAAGPVAARREHPLEVKGDLPVASGDDDVHPRESRCEPRLLSD